MKNLILLISIILLSLGCGTDVDSKVAKRPTAKNAAKKLVKNKNNPKDNYFVRLQNELKLTNTQVQKLKSTNKTFTKKIKGIPKKNKKLIQQTRKAKQIEIKKILGKDLYKKKLDFDKRNREKK